MLHRSSVPFCDLKCGLRIVKYRVLEANEGPVVFVVREQKNHQAELLSYRWDIHAVLRNSDRSVVPPFHQSEPVGQKKGRWYRQRPGG
ncbi:hypothetical protein ACS5PK_09485 [Roseateles sp. DB2]|uniref:hypothetical protein n=1 Tax=Roseateles sp. DB2 TaxID=3453717 RepID=UPI003EE8F721